MSNRRHLTLASYPLLQNPGDVCLHARIPDRKTCLPAVADLPSLCIYSVSRSNSHGFSNSIFLL